jgi:hypothetical protein
VYDNTRSEAIIAGAAWQNGWGGMKSLPADLTRRKGLNEAAAEVATAIAPQLQ